MQASVCERMTRICEKDKSQTTASATPLSSTPYQSQHRSLDLLYPIRQWIDSWEIKSPKVARLISKLIPAQCPFERDITLFGRHLGHIPPLCKLNPLYEQFVSLRFRCLCFLVDQCGEDIHSYI